MIDLILNPATIWTALVAAAICTPVVARVTKARLPHRVRLLLAGSGPAALLLWLLHNAALAAFGFDSVLALLFMAVCCTGLGWWAGRWAAADPTRADAG